MDDVGRRIKRARQQKGLSQQALADLTHVSQPTVANWEKGSHAPRHKALGKLSHILDTSPSWLLGETIYSNGPEGPLPRSGLTLASSASAQGASDSPSDGHSDSSSDSPSGSPHMSSKSRQPKFNRDDSHHKTGNRADIVDNGGRLHHIATLDWPSCKEHLWSAPVRHYISTHIDAIRPIALYICKNATQQCDHVAKFSLHSTLIIDLGKTIPKKGALFLVEDQGKIKLHRFDSDDAPTMLPILGQAIMSQQNI